MDLADALGGSWPGQNNPQPGAGGMWPGGNQPNQPQWPGQPGGAPGGQPGWPGQPGGAPGAQPGWPGQPGGAPGAQPGWPGQPGGAPGGQPGWPGQPGGQPGWPGQPAGQPTWPGQPGPPGGGPSAPAGWPGPNQGPGMAPPTAPQMSLAVPFGQTLPGGVFDKLLITIKGTIKANPSRITVDLNANNDLAFHFNPRFNDHGKKVIVRNSMISSIWGKEERELGNFPFVAGQAFEMKILCTKNEFKVAVNKTHLLEFKHRFRDLRSINKMSIYDDVTLSSVQLETLP